MHLIWLLREFQKINLYAHDEDLLPRRLSKFLPFALGGHEIELLLQPASIETGSILISGGAHMHARWLDFVSTSSALKMCGAIMVRACICNFWQYEYTTTRIVFLSSSFENETGRALHYKRLIRKKVPALLTCGRHDSLIELLEAASWVASTSFESATS